MKRKTERSSHIVESDNEAVLYERVRELVVNARRTVARGVDLMQVHTNFEIGRHVVAHEQQGKTRAAYGKEVLRRLAEKLTAEFGRGFSKSNLEYMRRFFLAYQERMSIAQSEPGQSMTVLQDDAEIAQSQTGQLAAVTSKTQPFRLSWTHYVFLMGIKNPDERSFYEIESSERNWNLRELRRQFDSGLYERLALSRDKEGVRRLSREGQIVSQPQDLLKEPLVLEFLGLSEQGRNGDTYQFAG